MTDAQKTIETLIAQGQASLSANAISDAVQIFEEVLALDADNGLAKAGLALGLAVSEKFDAALPLLEQATTSTPRDTRLLDAIALTYLHTGAPEKAELTLRKSLRLGGSKTDTMVNLASVLNECGKFADAEAMFRSCLRRDPDHILAHYNLGLLELLNGNLSNGWGGFELRNRVVGRGAPTWADQCPAPYWNGERINGKTVLVYAEQGLGDTIQFVRFARYLAEMNACVILQCQLALVDLLGSVDGISACISVDEVPPDVDFKVSLLSLPLHLGTTVETIPAPVPYIPVDPSKLAIWQQKLSGSDGRPKVGIAWSGNPKNKTDYKRSIPLELMQPILAEWDFSFFSLQVGGAADQVLELAKADRPDQMFEEVLPFQDVAASIQCLDLVITVDTALAHLSGAIGTPVWTLITHFPDWRWMLDRDDTPWYPDMRLFRQPSVGDWPRVIEDVRQALSSHRFS